MTYKLSFHPDALAEWRKLDATVSEQFKKKLAERLPHPRVPSAKLAGHQDRYKIKLRSVGFRLVYEVRDGVLLVIVVAVGKRERNAVYRVAAKR
ncbi:MAG TPA: type II toxin-antitoxin system RelE/ParE family toxin [Gallionella sp.]|nr:type II toxin-antitoxin system RelE/ParE family toxin [Gallionella sp.]